MSRPQPAQQRDDGGTKYPYGPSIGRPRPSAHQDNLVECFDALALAGKADKRVDKKLPDLPPSPHKGVPTNQNTNSNASAARLVDGQTPHGPTTTSNKFKRKFIGGFDPVLLTVSSALDSFRRPPLVSPQPNGKAVPPTARPPPSVPMPSPQTGQLSRTMQHALQIADIPAGSMSSSPPITPPRNEVDTAGSSATPPQRSKPNTPIVPVAKSASTGASTPTRVRGRSNSASSSTSSGQGKVKCCAIAKTTNKQCTRDVKVPLMLSALDPVPAVYCHQHKQSVNAEPGFYVRREGQADRFVHFDGRYRSQDQLASALTSAAEYVPAYLKLETQQALRAEMAKAPSNADVPGYIYTFEIRDPSNKYLIQLKVGRAVNLNKRLDQWDKQCGSKAQIVRGWWPGNVEPDDDDDGANGGLLKGNIKAGEPGPLCHRVERLVHIELADLSLYAPYLEQGWPRLNNSRRSPSATSSASNAPLAIRKTLDSCPDCGVVHREIFSFRRPNNGKYKGREWDLIVKPVIEKWGRFVKEYYS
ncbi:hypothetical protein ID866_8199 [Astraeus odoratus]|nr:hypothetical protein ID866_8199 [Astraeus odoratus]